MPLTRDFRETLRARAARDPEFRKKLLRKGIDVTLDRDRGRAATNTSARNIDDIIKRLSPSRRRRIETRAAELALRLPRAKPTPMSMNNPVHPGEFIRTEILEPAGLSVSAAARALRISRYALNNLVTCKAPLSGDIALRIEKAFGMEMETLMRMQCSYDIAQTRRSAKRVRIRQVLTVTAPRLATLLRQPCVFEQTGKPDGRAVRK